MNIEGTNTAHRTSAIAISADPTSFMLLRAASRGVKSRRNIAFDILDHDDGIVDDDTDRQNQTEQGKIVEREAESRHEEKAADKRHGYGDERNDGGPPSLQEQDHDQHDQHDRLADRVDHRVDRLLDELRRIINDRVLNAGGKRWAKTFIRSVTPLAVAIALDPGR